MVRKVSWGVLSTARIGWEKVLPAMQQGEWTSVDALASRDEARGREVAGRLGIPKVHGSYEALLADPAIEAIYNPLPNHLHVPLSIAALEAGKHVLCEKPIGLTVTEAEMLAEAGRRTGKLVAEAFMVRHHPQWKTARQLAQGGRIGEVRAIQTVFSYFNDDPGNIRNQAEIGGGGLYDIGCYAITTSRYIFGAEPSRVIALFDRDPVMKTDRLTSGLMEFPGGRQLSFTCSTQLTLHQHVTIMGTKGRIEVPVPFNALPGKAMRLIVDDGRDLVGGGAEVIAVEPCDQYTLQGDAFSRAVRGEEPLSYGMDDAIANMRIIEAFFRSGETGSWASP
ncbi:MAG: Gfo/Idh/MocA family oxidoreductase [Alsobacter sp.]